MDQYIYSGAETGVPVTAGVSKHRTALNKAENQTTFTGRPKKRKQTHNVNHKQGGEKETNDNSRAALFQFS